MSIAFPRLTSTNRPIDATPIPPIHWPSAFVGLALAVLVVVSISWLAAPRRLVKPLQPTVALAAQSEVATDAQMAVPTPILPPALAEPAPAPVPEKVRVAFTNGSNLNLRARAGEKAQRVKSVPEGSVLEIVGPDETADGLVWRNVRDASGTTGFVAGKFVARVEP